MIGVLMGDENRGQRFGIMAGGVEAFKRLFAGQAGIDQNAGPLRSNERGVAGA